LRSRSQDTYSIQLGDRSSNGDAPPSAHILMFLTCVSTVDPSNNGDDGDVGAPHPGWATPAGVLQHKIIFAIDCQYEGVASNLKSPACGSRYVCCSVQSGPVRCPKSQIEVVVRMLSRWVTRAFSPPGIPSKGYSANQLLRVTDEASGNMNWSGIPYHALTITSRKGEVVLLITACKMSSPSPTAMERRRSGASRGPSSWRIAA